MCLFMIYLQLCGQEIMDSSENETPLMDSIDIPKTSGQDVAGASVTINTSQPDQRTMTLSQEFSLVNRYIPNVAVEKVIKTTRNN